MSGIAVGRLTEERKNWRKDHPPGFHARPLKKADNSTDVMVWETGIPGKVGTDWEGGVYKVKMEFPDEYPSKVNFSLFFNCCSNHCHRITNSESNQTICPIDTQPPKCMFVPPLFHPNVYVSMRVFTLSHENFEWNQAITD